MMRSLLILQSLLILGMRRAHWALQEFAPHVALLTLPGGYSIALTGLVHRHWPHHWGRT